MWLHRRSLAAQRSGIASQIEFCAEVKYYSNLEGGEIRATLADAIERLRP